MTGGLAGVTRQPVSGNTNIIKDKNRIIRFFI
jgi:hypothetical protein